MKVRIINDRIRLRLSLKDVEDLVRGNSLAIQIDIGAGGKLGFSLLSEPTIHEISLALYGSILQIAVPETIVHAWAESDQIGMEGTVTGAGGSSVFVQIEKDLPCEHPKKT